LFDRGDDFKQILALFEATITVLLGLNEFDGDTLLLLLLLSAGGGELTAEESVVVVFLIIGLLPNIEIPEPVLCSTGDAFVVDDDDEEDGGGVAGDGESTLPPLVAKLFIFTGVVADAAVEVEVGVVGEEEEEEVGVVGVVVVIVGVGLLLAHSTFSF